MDLAGNAKDVCIKDAKAIAVTSKTTDDYKTAVAQKRVSAPACGFELVGQFLRDHFITLGVGMNLVGAQRCVR